MFAEDRNDSVRATVIKSLALVMTIVQSPAKYKEVILNCIVDWSVVKNNTQSQIADVRDDVKMTSTPLDLICLIQAEKQSTSFPGSFL
jgi:hypothetical protein